MERQVDLTKYADPEGMELLWEVEDRIAPRWRLRTLSILQERNQELLRRLEVADIKVNSLLVIKDKPKELQKRLKDALVEYENVYNLAIAYAARHQ